MLMKGPRSSVKFSGHAAAYTSQQREPAAKPTRTRPQRRSYLQQFWDATLPHALCCSCNEGRRFLCRPHCRIGQAGAAAADLER